MKVNGDLKFRTLGSGELQNAIIERLATDPTGASGRIYYNTVSNEYRYFDGTTWKVFGNTTGLAALQTEVDAIETASGGIFDTDGTYDGTTVDAALSNVTGSTDLLNALTQLDAAISTAAGVDTLKELTDVDVDGEGSPATTDPYEVGQVLFYDSTNSRWRSNSITGGIQVDDLLKWDGSNWANVQASTIGGNAFGTISGDTGSAVADQTSDTITIAGATGAGIVTAASGTTTDLLEISLDINALTGGSATLGLTDTIAVYDGTDTLSYSLQDLVQDLDIVNGITANGMVVRTAADTYASRTITASTAAGDQGISVVNGDGVSGNPTVGLDIVGLTAEAGTPASTDVLAMYDGTNNVKVTIDQLASAMNSVLTLSELSDVNDSLPTTDGSVMYYNSNLGFWTASAAPADNQVMVWNTAGSPNGYVPTDVTSLSVNAAKSITMSAKKNTAGTITAGQVVYLVSHNGTDHLVELAQANSTSTMPGFAIAISTITNTTAGEIVVYGEAEFDTTGLGSAGQEIYVSATVAGGLTNVRPVGLGTIVQKIGLIGSVGSSGHVEMLEPFGRALPQFTNANYVWQSDTGGTPTEVSVPTLLTFGELDDLSNVTGQPSGANEFLVSTGANAWGVETAADARTSLGLVAGGAGDIWVEKAGDTMTGDLTMSGAGTQVLLAAGTATDPALTFAADPNTGLNGAGDTLSLVAGGTTQATVSGTALSTIVPVQGAAGSATAPTYSFTGDTNTGMYQIAADTLGFAVGGTVELQLNPDGTLAVDGGGADAGYAALVTEGNDIPNKAYVDAAITAGTGSLTLNDLTDVSATGAAAGDIMYYQAGSPAGWVIGQPGSTSGIQAQCAALDDICTAGPTTAGDQFYYSTAAGTLSLATVTSAGRALLDDASAADQRTTLGLVAGGAGDIWVEKAGDTMTGNLVMSAGFDVTLPDVPTNPTDAANKAYVDSQVSSGVVWRNPIFDPNLVDIVAGNAEPATPVVNDVYILDGAGSGGSASWNALADKSAAYWDGSAWQLIDVVTSGDRFIISGETSTTAGSGLTGIGFSDNEVIVYNGGAIATDWTNDENTSSVGSPIDIGITVLASQSANSPHHGHTYHYDGTSWIEIGGPASIGAGVGLSYSGNVLNVNLGAGIFELPSDEVGIELHDAVTGALILTTDGSTRSTSSATKLHLLLGSAGGLEQDASGLRVDINNMTAATIVGADELAFADASNANVASKTTVTNFLADLDIVNGISANGFTVRTAADTYTSRSITVAGAGAGDGLAVTNGDGVSGDPVLELDIDGNALAGENVASGDLFLLYNASATANEAFTLAEVTAGVVSSGIALNDLSDVTISTPVLDNIVRYTGSGWVNDTISNVLDQATIGDLGDVTALNDTAGEVLVDAGSSGGLVPQAIQFNYDSTKHGGSATSHTVVHNLGQKFVNVTVYLQTDSSGGSPFVPDTFTQVIPQSVTLNSANQLTVTFNSAIQCVVVVSGVPGVALA